MYITNLPDEVMIPESLVKHIDAGTLTGQAHVDAKAWVKVAATYEHGVRDYWKLQIERNVTACRRYGIPECAEFFASVCKLIEEAW